MMCEGIKFIGCYPHCGTTKLQLTLPSSENYTLRFAYGDSIIDLMVTGPNVEIDTSKLPIQELLFKIININGEAIDIGGFTVFKLKIIYKNEII